MTGALPKCQLIFKWTLPDDPEHPSKHRSKIKWGEMDAYDEDTTGSNSWY
jgi:hypothetical protein